MNIRFAFVSFTQALAHALGDFRARPFWVLLVVTVLTCGLSSVLFSLTLIHGMMLRPYPYPEPQQLHMMGARFQGDDGISDLPFVATQDLSERLKAVVEAAGDGHTNANAWSGERPLTALFNAGNTMNLVDGERADRLDGGHAEPGMFALLGVKPLLGHEFAPSDAQSGAPNKVMLTESLWRKRFDADPSVIGRVVRVNNRSTEIIGVLPDSARFPARTELWVPLRADQAKEAFVQLIVRAANEEQRAAVFGVFAAWHQSLQQSHPNYRNSEAASENLTEYIVDPGTRSVFGIMLAASLMVLLVACGNTTNLLLARHLARRQEMAVRNALGASRGHLMMQLLLPAFLLSGFAALLAWPLAQAALGWVISVLESTGDSGPPVWISFTIDPGLFLIIIVIALLTGLVSGIWPALQMSRGAQTVLRDGGKGLIGSRLSRLGGWLVAGEVAFSASLLIGALATVQAVRALTEADLGVRTEHVLTARVGLVGERFDGEEARRAFWQTLGDRIREAPGVVSASVSSTLPGYMGDGYMVLPDDGSDDSTSVHINSGAVDLAFPETMGTKLMRGRWFDATDRADTEAVMVVDRTFVERFAEGAEILGRRFRLNPGSPDERSVRVVGVTEVLTLEDPDDQVMPSALMPISQVSTRFATLMVKTQGEPEAFKPSLTALMREIDPDTPLYWLRSYDEVRRIANMGQIVLMHVYSGLGIMALLMAAGGLYGVIATSVAQRTGEIGVRRALGASANAVLSGVLQRTGLQVGGGLFVGLLLGIPLALLMVADIRSDSGRLDPGIWLLVTLVLLLVALAAAWIPARRALSVEPSVALRS